jgi:hypothetical protein
MGVPFQSDSSGHLAQGGRCCPAGTSGGRCARPTCPCQGRARRPRQTPRTCPCARPTWPCQGQAQNQRQTPRTRQSPACAKDDSPRGVGPRAPSMGPPRRETRIAPGGCCCRKRRGTRVRGSRKIVVEDSGRITTCQLLKLAWITPPPPPPPPGYLSKCKQV